jgi:hypothetical protein
LHARFESDRLKLEQRAVLTNDQQADIELLQKEERETSQAVRRV